MKKVSIKVFFSTFLLLLLASLVPRFVNRIFHLRQMGNQEPEEWQVIVFTVGTFAVLLLTFSVSMNRIIIRRIKRLTDASKEVTNGNYEVLIEEKGKDEVSEVIHNFNIMTKALKSNEYLNRDFVRNFAHEFKTPLSIIKGYSELIESSDKITEEEKQYLKIIISESNRLSNLSQNMMLISLVDNTTIIPKNDTYNLAEQIRNIIQLMQLEWENKNLELDLELTDLEVITNKELLYQVFLNIIGNAIKFSNDNESLKISLIERKDKYQIDVTNIGQVIPKADFDKVFKLFYIADKSRSKKSTGIGLTLTKKIIDKLEGDILFTSEDGKTTFTIILNKKL